MAASYGLDSMPPVAADVHSIAMAASVEAMATPVSPRHVPSPVSIPPRDDNLNLDLDRPIASGPQPSPSGHNQPSPLPLPSFAFPTRPSTSAPSSYSRATGRRPKSVADLHERPSIQHGMFPTPDMPSRSPALPSFVFNPGANLSPTPDHAFLCPLLSPLPPQSPRAIPVRPTGAGHRRGGSEFVGGSVRGGDAYALLSTSPTRSENGFPSPKLAPVSYPGGPPASGPPGGGPPAGRRGHAHRRSAAITSHDIASALHPLTPFPSARGNSAPSSPAEFKPLPSTFTFPPSKTSIEEPMPFDDVVLPPAEVDVVQPTVAPRPAIVEEHSQATSDFRAMTRARVGFSDTLEFIPRPLSLVSNDTSSTITARPGGRNGQHSVSGSISSIISMNSIGAPSSDKAFSPLARNSSRGTTGGESRPSTAGAVLERSQSIAANSADESCPRRRNSIPILSAIPAATDAAGASPAQPHPSPNKTPKRWSFFSLDPFMSGGSPVRPRAVCTDAEKGLVAGPESATADHSESDKGAGNVLAAGAADDDPFTKPITRKVSNKKKKKAKTWSILTRKSKQRRKARRAPTPPPIVAMDSSDDEESVEELAVEPLDNLSPPTLLVTPSDSPEEIVTELPVWHAPPSPSLSAPDDDAAFAMIDLDAALGPFNTPLPRNSEWEAAQRAGGLSIRQLHSAAGMTRFSGPGMHYSHRRAESAPEMPPFNRAGLPRFGSSATMADVFEEDEEEDDESDSQKEQVVKKQVGKRALSMNSSVPAGGSRNTPHRRSAEVTERHSSIDIRVTSSDGPGIVEDKAYAASAAPSEDAMSSITPSRRGSNLSVISDDDRTQPSMGLKSEYSASSLHDDVIAEEEICGFSFDVPDNGWDFSLESASDSTVNAPSRLKKGKDLSPVDVSPLHMPTNSLAPVSPFSISPASTYPSPRSPMSFDANIISTAPSSVTTGDNFQSLLLGEPGPELRRSMDIPSLASSVSTTRDSEFYSIPQVPPMPTSPSRGCLPSRGADRPASFTSSAFGRRRSSLASLHRLINTSHGERSKLSMEVPADDDLSTKTADSDKRHSKVSRTKRLSRMMQFWRSRDETEP